MSGSPVLEFTDDNFAAEVLQAPLPTLVEFWATWSSPSRAMLPTTTKLAKAHAGELKVGRLDIDANMNTPKTYGVTTIPLMLLFKSGQVVEIITGNQPYSKIEEKIARYL